MLVVVWYWKPHTWAFPVVLWMCPVPIELITAIKATERASWLRTCWGECLALFQLLGELLGSQSCLRIAFLACEMCRIWNKFYIDIKYAFYHFLLWVYSLERPGEQTWEPNLSWRLGLHPFLLWKLNLEQFLTVRELLRQYQKLQPLWLLFLLLPGGLCPSILLLDTLEDSRDFATIKDLHEPAGRELTRDEWMWHPTHSAVVFPPPDQLLCQLDKGTTRLAAMEYSKPTYSNSRNF